MRIVYEGSYACRTDRLAKVVKKKLAKDYPRVRFERRSFEIRFRREGWSKNFDQKEEAALIEEIEDEAQVIEEVAAGYEWLRPLFSDSESD